ncbi:AAA family ATPase [Thalassospira profundimaris]|uniref:AAA family ATPase n=1 Tax=Thalassospira profundimaris TaxID=502049 RepID=UPI000DED7AE2|nr:AAA family ATPase [Thalassospira profundimaris]
MNKTSQTDKPKRKKRGPRFVRLLGPTLDALRTLGGIAEPKQVFEEVAKSSVVSEDDLKLTNKNGLSNYENQVGWAKFYLGKAGLVTSKKRGVWELTNEGRETQLDHEAALELFEDVHARYKTASDDDDEEAPSDDLGHDIFDDPKRQFWFVGAVWNGNEDQLERFVSEGVWQNGYTDRHSGHVARMRPGDRIAIKSTYVQKYKLPFVNHDKPVSCMRIKALGTITHASTDGRTVKVAWQPLEPPLEWYFFTYRITIVKADASDEYARRLILFTFAGHKQDYEFWLRQPYWVKRYRKSESSQTEIDLEQEEVELDNDAAEFVPYGLGDIVADGCFLPQRDIDGAISRLEAKKNLILQGPPGTGKTWLAKRLGYALIGTRDRAMVRKRMRSIQFHPSLSYEDFVRGWRPDGDGHLALIDGMFLEAIEAARAEPDLPFVVIIEEINRGNPAQIFGEMLTLLEKDKRREEEAIELAYSRAEGERIFIPQNLFVIGTMNIADRSLALVDLALRRRFAFVSLDTNLNDIWHKWCCEQTGMDVAVLDRIKIAMKELNAEIAADKSLGPQFCIGHSYVTPGTDDEIRDGTLWFKDIVETEIYPLLEEYWFDNLDKAAASRDRLLQAM